MTERRELTFDDVLQFAGVHEAQSRLERLMPGPGDAPDALRRVDATPPLVGAGSPMHPTPSSTSHSIDVGRSGRLVGALAVVTQAATACSPLTVESDEEREAKLLARKGVLQG